MPGGNVGASVATPTPIDVSAASAPAGISTLAPLDATVPPVGPVAVVVGGCVEPDEPGEPDGVDDDEHCVSMLTATYPKSTTPRQLRAVIARA